MLSIYIFYPDLFMLHLVSISRYTMYILILEDWIEATSQRYNYSQNTTVFLSLELKIEKLNLKLTISSTSSIYFTVSLVYQTQSLWSGGYLRRERERELILAPTNLRPVYRPELRTPTGGIRLGCLKTTRLSSL